MDELNGTAVLDEQPSSTAPSLPPRPSPKRGLFFSSSSTEEPESPSPLESTSTEQLDDGSGSGPDEWSEPSPDLDEDTSSRGSTPGGKPLSPLTKAALRATIAQGVIIGSGMAHRIAARTEGQQAVGLYVADTEDADNIAGPLASIAHRRGGIAGGAISPDTNDAIQMLMGLAGYVSKQVGKTVAAKEIDAHLAAGGTLSEVV